MATVILGGLISSTLLDIIVTPVVFHQFGKKALVVYEANKNQPLSPKMPQRNGWRLGEPT